VKRSPHPRCSPLTAAEPNTPQGGPAWTVGYPPFSLLLPVRIEHLAGRRQPFRAWEGVCLGVGIAIPPQMASGQRPAVTLGCVTAGSEEHPGQDPGTDALAGARNDLVQKERTAIPAGIPACPPSWCRSKYKHLPPKSDWVARSQVQHPWQLATPKNARTAAEKVCRE